MNNGGRQTTPWRDIRSTSGGYMKSKQFTRRLQDSLVGTLTAMSFSWSAAALAHDHEAQAATSQQHTPAQENENAATSDFVRVVREVSARFRDVSEAVKAGYVEQFGCVSGSHEGAMGVHFVNGPLVGDGVLDVTQPELLVYEPLPNGRLRLVAVDYLVLSEAWHASNTAPPELKGQLFHLFESPNRFGLPEFYTLHVWAWKSNPQGLFANWNPRVSCDAFTRQE
jgi:hypothetical protein